MQQEDQGVSKESRVRAISKLLLISSKNQDYYSCKFSDLIELVYSWKMLKNFHLPNLSGGNFCSNGKVFVL